MQWSLTAARRWGSDAAICPLLGIHHEVRVGGSDAVVGRSAGDGHRLTAGAERYLFVGDRGSASAKRHGPASPSLMARWPISRLGRRRAGALPRPRI